MSVRFQVVANLASQLFVTLLGIVLVPVYLKWLGAEAYGLVGLFATVQAWFNFLDMGLTPILARESSRFHAGALPALDFRRLFRAMGVAFAALALLGAVVLWVLAPWVQAHWLDHRLLSASEVTWALRVMALAVVLRWVAGLYRGFLTGTDRQLGLAGLVAVMASVRYFGVLAAMALWGASVQVFFGFQLLASLVETGAMALWTHRVLPPVVERLGWGLGPLRGLWRMSGALAFVSGVWVLVNQADKLLLSGLLPLADYGLFSLAVVLAGGVMVLGAALSQALMPRLAQLHAQGDGAAMMALYRRGSRWMSALGLGGALALALLAEPVLWAWTGDAALASSVARVLSLYALGYGAVTLGAFPYYLQYAVGRLRLHVYGNLLLLVVLCPLVWWVAPRWGAVGTGWVWLALNVLFWMGWGAVVHRRFWPGEHGRWLWRDAGLSVLPSLLLGWLLWLWSPVLMGRWWALLWVVLAATVLVSSNVLCLWWRERREAAI